MGWLANIYSGETLISEMPTDWCNKNTNYGMQNIGDHSHDASEYGSFSAMFSNDIGNVIAGNSTMIVTKSPN